VNAVQRTNETFCQRERFSPRSLHDLKSEYLAEDRAKGREAIHYQKHRPENRDSSGKREPSGAKVFPDVPGERDDEKCGWHEREPKRNRIRPNGRRLQHPQLGKGVPCCTKSRQREEEMGDLGASLEPNRQMEQRQSRAH